MLIPASENAALSDGEWISIPRVSRIIPFGYVVDPEDVNMLLPVPFELEALKRARYYAKTHSVRSVAQWLSSVTGRYISHVGLRKRFQVETTRRKRVAALKNWANKLTKIHAKVEKWEEQATGAVRKDSGNSEL